LHALTDKALPNTSPWTGMVAVLLLLSAAMLQLVGLSMLPEGPLLLLGLLSARQILRVAEQNRLSDWALLGMYLGFAGLAKYTAILLLVTLIGFLISSRQWHWLVQPGPWLAALLAATLVTPVFWWNWEHEWISFAYQLQHGTGAAEWRIGRLVKSQLHQLLAFGPMVYLGAVLAAFSAWRSHRANPGVQLLLWLSLPVLALFLVSSGYQESLPHWTALGWVSLLPLLANWLISGWSRRQVRWFAKGAASYSILVIVLLFSQLAVQFIPFPEYRHPLRDLIGWREAALRGVQLLQKESDPVAPLMVENWSQASRIAWYARPQPVQPLDRRHDQFDLWFGSPQSGEQGLLIAVAYNKMPARRAHRYFEQCVHRGQLPVTVAGNLVSRFEYYWCTGYRGQK